MLLEYYFAKKSFVSFLVDREAGGSCFRQVAQERIQEKQQQEEVLRHVLKVGSMFSFGAKIQKSKS